jgi:hypothetical protein
MPEMRKVVCTELDGRSWEPHGITWMRAVKSAGYAGLVVDKGLPAAAKDKLTDLKFDVMDGMSPYAALASHLQPGEVGFVSDPDKLAQVVFHERLACGRSDLSLASLVLPIPNIWRRAKMADVIEEKVIAAHGGLFDPRLACGRQEDWADFSGFYEFLLSNLYIEGRRGADIVAMNIFASYFPGRVSTI